MIKLEPLTGHHDRKAFDCGVDALNQWFRQIAIQHQNKGISRTFVAVPADQSAAQTMAAALGRDTGTTAVLGFYALASALVVIEDIPIEMAKSYPRQIPVTRLGRLAILTSLQGQGLGELLLMDAMARTRSAAQTVGSAGLVVDAKTDGAARFYQRYGFVPCGDRPLKLFMPIGIF